MTRSKIDVLPRRMSARLNPNRDRVQTRSNKSSHRVQPVVSPRSQKKKMNPVKEVVNSPTTSTGVPPETDSQKHPQAEAKAKQTDTTTGSAVASEQSNASPPPIGRRTKSQAAKKVMSYHTLQMHQVTINPACPPIPEVNEEWDIEESGDSRKDEEKDREEEHEEQLGTGNEEKRFVLINDENNEPPVHDDREEYKETEKECGGLELEEEPNSEGELSEDFFYEGEETDEEEETYRLKKQVSSSDEDYMVGEESATDSETNPSDMEISQSESEGDTDDPEDPGTEELSEAHKQHVDEDDGRKRYRLIERLRFFAEVADDVDIDDKSSDEEEEIEEPSAPGKKRKRVPEDSTYSRRGPHKPRSASAPEGRPKLTVVGDVEFQAEPDDGTKI